MWAAWQLSVLAIGLTCLDHFQPGSNVARPTAPASRLTNSTFPFPSSNGRVSSGESRLLRIILAMSISPNLSVITADHGGNLAPRLAGRTVGYGRSLLGEENDPWILESITGSQSEWEKVHDCADRMRCKATMVFVNAAIISRRKVASSSGVALRYLSLSHSTPADGGKNGGPHGTRLDRPDPQLPQTSWLRGPSRLFDVLG